MQGIRQLWHAKDKVEYRAIGGFSPLICRMLARRGVNDEESLYYFLLGDELPLKNPLLLPDMDKAKARIELAQRRNERVCVYGDYDADGVCSTAILTDCLKTMGMEVSYYIPSRHREGYGMNLDAVKRLADGGATLIITVDNGISAFEEIAYLKSRGIDVIITDHHQCREDLPSCEAVVCPTRLDNDRSEKTYCGAGVALKLACALLGERRCEKYIPLAAVATVADLVPLTGENRAIVKRGLKLLNCNLGLSALIKAAGSEEAELNEDGLAFIIAPRLNAAGRLGDAARAARLLLSQNGEEAALLAEELNEENLRRKEEEQRIFEQCLSREKEIANAPITVLAGEDWNSGVIGIVASRLVERYGKPAMLFTRGGDGLLIGSGRSTLGVNLFGLLNELSDCLVRFGGHESAAGATIEEHRLAEFIGRASERLKGLEPAQTFVYEDEAELYECNLRTCAQIERLAPFGVGNERPILRINGCKLSEIRTMGKDGSHLSARVIKDGSGLRLVAFKMGEQAQDWMKHPRCDLLVRLKKNSFRGTDSAELYFVSKKDEK
ncbi:MAG: single-stranded-DNA-specific exonuclease RecJ [Clostridia bacterium]|nr:single-stranded-DNA-specific exonuclease RecJ [Clostridia bacterium]